jgi:hypothetical protein
MFFAIRYRPVVGTRQVVVRDGFEVDGVVMSIGGTHSPRRFVEGIGQKEVRTRQHPVARVGDEGIVARGTPLIGTVLLLHGFVPHLGGRIIITQIGEAARVAR